MPTREHIREILHPGQVEDYFNPRIHHCRHCAVRWRSVGGVAATQGKRPDMSEKDIQRYLESWIDVWNWHDALTRWTVWALDVLNSPSDTFQVHVLLIELEQRIDCKPPFHVFTGDAVRVIHRNQLAVVFQEQGMPQEEVEWCLGKRWGKDDVQVCVVYRDHVAHFKGKYKPGIPEPIGSGLPLRIGPDAQKQFYHALTRTWYIYLMCAIGGNDPTLTDQYIERMMYDTADIFPVEVVITSEQEKCLEGRKQRIAEIKEQQRMRGKEGQRQRKRAREGSMDRFSPEAEVGEGEFEAVEASVKSSDDAAGLIQNQNADSSKCVLAAEATSPARETSKEILSQTVPELLQQLQIDFSKIVQDPRVLI